MAEQTIKDVRLRLYDAITDAQGAMLRTLAVFDPRDLAGEPIEISEKRKQPTLIQLEEAMNNLMAAYTDYQHSIHQGAGMTRTITKTYHPEPLE